MPTVATYRQQVMRSRSVGCHATLRTAGGAGCPTHGTAAALPFGRGRHYPQQRRTA